MQVTHTEDKVTHAVISSKAASSFGITNSAEFFHILSDTLYSDKPLAVVREVLCNAWDAHIDAGITDVAIEVLVSEEAMIVRDFGRGIPKDMIEQIYCTYGESTKRNDGTQTGGFGLGSKSPFAVTDTFEVTSCHDGIKTIYRISKSLPELDGRPGVIEIVSVPTKESGVTVNIPMKSDGRSHIRFNDLVQVISRNGEMLTNHNGTMVENLVELTKAPNNWLFTTDATVSGNTGVAVRYGNVIYPIPPHEAYQPIYEEIRNLRSQMPSSGNGLTMVFLAPPHSISVTPSRESLSMTEHTINTLQGLMEDFAASFNRILEVECKVQARKMIEESVNSSFRKDLYKANYGIPGCVDRSGYGSYRHNGTAEHMSGALKTPTEIVRYFIKFNYPSFHNFKKFDAISRIEALVRHKLLPSNTATAFKKLVTRSYQRGGLHGASKQLDTFFSKEIIWPIKKTMMKRGVADLNLVFLSQNAINRSYATNARPDKLKEVNLRSVWDIFPWLRRVVIISHRTTDVHSRADAHPTVKRNGGVTNTLICIAPKNPEKKDAIFEGFKALGYEIVDLTFRQEWEEEPVKEVSAEPKKKPLRGLLPLNQVVQGKTGEAISNDYAWTVETRKIEVPQVVLRFGRSGADSYNREAVRMINRLFGHKVGVAVSSTQLQKYVKLGSVEFNGFFEREFLHKLQNDIGFLMRIGWDWGIIQERLKEEGLPQIEDIVDILHSDAAIRAHFRIRDILTEEDQTWLALWRYHRHARYWKKTIPVGTKARQIEDILTAIPLADPVRKIATRVQTSKLVRYLDFDEVKNALSSSGWRKPPYTEKLYARHLLLSVLKG